LRLEEPLSGSKVFPGCGTMFPGQFLQSATHPVTRRSSDIVKLSGFAGIYSYEYGA